MGRCETGLSHVFEQGACREGEKEGGPELEGPPVAGGYAGGGTQLVVQVPQL
jgi:hypothetical protein